MSHPEDASPRRVAVISGAGQLSAAALAALYATGITPVCVSEPLDDIDLDRLARDSMPFPEPSILDALAMPRRPHDARRQFRRSIHDRLFNPVAAPADISEFVVERPLTKRQRRRMKGKRS